MSGPRAAPSSVFVISRLHFSHGLASASVLRSLWNPRCAYSSQSSASSRWKLRQKNDYYAREAKIKGYVSRAANKLVQVDKEHRIFHPGQTVVDLGYAPGSWSQVAVSRANAVTDASNGSRPGIVVGIDLIPAKPPQGMHAIQGNFLLPNVRELTKQVLVDADRRRRLQKSQSRQATLESDSGVAASSMSDGLTDRPSYINSERQAAHQDEAGQEKQREKAKLVDVILSDMSEPLPLTNGFYINTISNPYRRLMNTSGNMLRDHLASMKLCLSALTFADETLRPGGHFVCKFYSGSEDKHLENLLKQLFSRVHRVKPGASRSESREAYFVATKRLRDRSFEELVNAFPCGEALPALTASLNPSPRNANEEISEHPVDEKQEGQDPAVHNQISS